MLKVKTFYFNLFRECTYVVSNEKGDALIVDAGCESESDRERLRTYMTDHQLSLRALLLTHAHVDHIIGTRFIFDQWGVLPYLSANDSYLFKRLSEQCAAFGFPTEEDPLSDFLSIEEGELKIEGFDDCSIRVISTPGHTLGGVCYHIHTHDGDDILFSGDTLFKEGIGRFDLPGGDYDTLLTSLAKLTTLPHSTQVYPGHGEPTTIEAEINENPYL